MSKTVMMGGRGGEVIGVARLCCDVSRNPDKMTNLFITLIGIIQAYTIPPTEP